MSRRQSTHACQGAHNPKVEGSNPSPATNEEQVRRPLRQPGEGVCFAMSTHLSTTSVDSALTSGPAHHGEPGRCAGPSPRGSSVGPRRSLTFGSIPRRNELRRTATVSLPVLARSPLRRQTGSSGCEDLGKPLETSNGTSSNPELGWYSVQHRPQASCSWRPSR